MRFDGAKFTRTPAPTTAQIMGLCGSSPRDVWAIDSSSQVLHFDGTEWKPTNGLVQSVSQCWVSDPTHIYALGQRGIFRLRPE
jgi:hypothetical protein